MFNFLKEKLKKAVEKFTKSVDEEAEETVEELPVEQKKPDKKPDTKQKAKQEKKPAQPKPQKQQKKKEIPAQVEEEPEKEEELPLEEIKKEKRAEEIIELPTQKMTPELAGIKETLETYSDEELASIMDILQFPPDAKEVPHDDKIKKILSMQLFLINSAIEQFEDLGVAATPQKEEEPVPEDTEEKEEEKEEEILEEVEKEEEQLEEEEKPKKEGFFKKIFGFGKKKEEAPLKEEPKKENKEEKVPEAPQEEPLPLQKPVPDTLDEVNKETKELEKELDEEDKEVEEKEEEEAQIKEEVEELEAEEEEAKGFFGKLKQSFVMKTLSDSKFNDMFFELEVALLENNVAVQVIDKIKSDLHEKIVDKKIKRSDIDAIVMKSLKQSLDQILSIEQVDVLKKIKEKRKQGKPYIITFVGINGSGKTTTIAKMAKYFMNNNLKIVLVAGDTFRAAAIQQLEEHANNLGIKIIKHDYGSDPAAVAFDGIKYAEAKGIDVVLIDTAGRLQTNTNLMDEMKKIMRVANPDLKIFVGESITGNDCIEQAQHFNEAVSIDGIVLSKADVDEKGGAAISVSYVTGKPILFIGTGQTYDSLQKFDKKLILENLGL